MKKIILTVTTLTTFVSLASNLVIVNIAKADEYDMRRAFRHCVTENNRGKSQEDCSKYDVSIQEGNSNSSNSGYYRKYRSKIYPNQYYKIKRKGFWSDFSESFFRNLEYETRNTRYRHRHGYSRNYRYNQDQCITINNELWCKR